MRIDVKRKELHPPYTKTSPYFWMSFKIDRLAISFVETGRLPLLPLPCSNASAPDGSRTVSSDVSALGKGPGIGTTTTP